MPVLERLDPLAPTRIEMGGRKYDFDAVPVAVATVGDSAAGRLARVAQLSRSSRRPVIVLAEIGDPPCSPLDWLTGPGCMCCLPATHPRHCPLQAASQQGTVRIIIDAGPPGIADRIVGLLRALPVPHSVHLMCA